MGAHSPSPAWEGSQGGRGLNPQSNQTANERKLLGGSFSIHVVQDPSHGLRPSTVGRSPHFN